MDKRLELSDFEWVLIDKNKANGGYYSFTMDKFEICLEEDYDGWRVYFCKINKEVLKEVLVDNQQMALELANKFYTKYTDYCLWLD